MSATTKAKLGARPAKTTIADQIFAASIQPSDNMKEEKLKDMSFKVSPEFHTQFKVVAARSNLSMRELLEESFRLWMELKQGN